MHYNSRVTHDGSRQSICCTADDGTYSALQGIGLAGDELLEAQHGGGRRDDRVDDVLRPRRMPAFPRDGRREPSRSGDEHRPWPGADEAHRQSRVDVHGEDGLHVVQDAFFEDVVPAGVALLGRLEHELHCTLGTKSTIMPNGHFL